MNIASQAGIVGLPQHVAYSAAKAAIKASRARVGTTRDAISPTIVETELGRRVWAVESGKP